MTRLLSRKVPLAELHCHLGGAVTPAMQAVAQAERVSVEQVVAELAAGRAVLPANPVHTCLVPQIVGRLFRTKVNANIGRSAARSCDDSGAGDAGIGCP